jgi:hypothetical protein
VEGKNARGRPRREYWPDLGGYRLPHLHSTEETRRGSWRMESCCQLVPGLTTKEEEVSVLSKVPTAYEENWRFKGRQNITVMLALVKTKYKTITGRRTLLSTLNYAYNFYTKMTISTDVSSR